MDLTPDFYAESIRQDDTAGKRLCATIENKEATGLSCAVGITCADGNTFWILLGTLVGYGITYGVVPMHQTTKKCFVDLQPLFPAWKGPSPSVTGTYAVHVDAETVVLGFRKYHMIDIQLG